MKTCHDCTFGWFDWFYVSDMDCLYDSLPPNLPNNTTEYKKSSLYWGQHYTLVENIKANPWIWIWSVITSSPDSTVTSGYGENLSLNHPVCLRFLSACSDSWSQCLELQMGKRKRKNQWFCCWKGLSPLVHWKGKRSQHINETFLSWFGALSFNNDLVPSAGHKGFDGYVNDTLWPSQWPDLNQRSTHMGFSAADAVADIKRGQYLRWRRWSAPHQPTPHIS